MERKFFLGIADNDLFASVVVGDPSGKVIATSVGGSVNYHYWGLEQARANLMDLVHQTVGWDRRASLAGACFTYKADFAVTEWKMPDLVSGFLEGTDVMVEDFATSSLLGMHGGEDRLFLVGGHSGLAVFEDSTGRQLQTRQEALMWNPIMRLNSKLQEVAGVDRNQCVEDLLYLKSQIALGKGLGVFTDILDQRVSQGSSLALEVAYELAYDLVQMVTSMSAHFRGLEPVIGLYGQILLGSQTIRTRVHHLLSLLFPQCRIVDVPLAPAKGAYLSSVLTRRSGFEQEVITNLFN
mgnify:FL=1|jgi:N-acetylglucosamine kinase-like BadF-type ATPase